MKQDQTPRDLLDWLGLRRYPDWRVARPIGMIFGMAATVLFALAVIAAFATVSRAIGGGAGSAGGNLGAGALIVAVLGAPFLIWGTIIKHRTLSAQMDGQITDRIAKAVEQLGAEKTVKEAGEGGATVERTRPNIEVRIGGILSLERIAQDSTAHDHGRDHVRVMEILCAYIRENAPASGAQDHDPKNDQAIGKWVTPLPPPRADIAIALQVIGRRNAEQRQAEAAWPELPLDTTKWVFATCCLALPEPDDAPAPTTAELVTHLAELERWKNTLNDYRGYRLDLRDTNLQRVDLSDLNFAGAFFENARLERAELRLARFEGADLRGARLRGASLWGAHLEGAELGRARFEGANLRRARLGGASLWGAHLEGVSLWGAHLEGTYLVQAHLAGAVLMLAHLEGANLWHAHLDGADLSLARMDASTNLDAASLRGAALRSVDFALVRLSQDQVNATFGDGSVILPDTLAHPAHWPKQILHISDFGFEWRKWHSSPAAYTPPPPPAP